MFKHVALLFSLFQTIKGSAAQNNKSLEGTHGELTEGYRSHVSVNREQPPVWDVH